MYQTDLAMLRIMTSDRDSITLAENRNSEGINCSPNWYNSLYRCLTNLRTVKLKRTCPDIHLKTFLLINSKLRIYTIISHEPIISAADEERVNSRQTTLSRIADIQRVRIDDEDYIDEFGRYVYLTSRVGTSADIDLRYEEVTEPELFNLQYIQR